MYPVDNIARGRTQLKVTSGISIVIAIIAIGLGASVYSWFLNFKLFGAWWGSIGIVLLGIYGFAVESK